MKVELTAKLAKQEKDAVKSVQAKAAEELKKQVAEHKGEKDKAAKEAADELLRVKTELETKAKMAVKEAEARLLLLLADKDTEIGRLLEQIREKDIALSGGSS